MQIKEEKESECTLGVGDGSGQMFVHGSYESIKMLQGKLLAMEKMYTLDQFITELKRFGREHVLTSQDIYEFKKWFEENTK